MLSRSSFILLLKLPQWHGWDLEFSEPIVVTQVERLLALACLGLDGLNLFLNINDLVCRLGKLVL